MNIKKLLLSDLSLIDKKVFSKIAKSLIVETNHNFDVSNVDGMYAFIGYLLNKVDSAFEKIKNTQAEYINFSTSYATSINESDKRELLKKFAKTFKVKGYKGDVRALNRWFDADVIAERSQKKISRTERRLKYYLDRVSYALVWVIQQEQKSYQSQKWVQLNLKKYFLMAFYYEGDTRLKVYAFESLLKLVNAIPLVDRETSLSTEVKQFIIRSSQDKNQLIELQQLSLTLLIKFTRRNFIIISQTVMAKDYQDAFFLRAHIARLISYYWQELCDQHELLVKLARDESDYVRIELFKSLASLHQKAALDFVFKYLEKEPSSQVQAVASLTLCRNSFLKHNDVNESFSALLQSLLKATDADYLIRSILHSIPALFHWVQPEKKNGYIKEWMSLLHQFRNNANKPKLRKWTSLAINHLWVLSNNNRHQLMKHIRHKVEQLPLKKRKVIHIPALDCMSDDELGRLLAVVNQNDFPLDIQRKGSVLRIQRWYRFRFRFWRFWYELKNSTTDKRQAHFHLIGRVFKGHIAIPSDVLAEQTITKVPGEPLYQPEEDGPRNYLPLVDELISCLDQNWPIKPLKIYSADGVTTLSPPTRLWRRLTAKFKLSTQFEVFAQYRNWDNNSQDKPNTYIAKITELGFNVHYHDYVSGFEAQEEPSKHPTIKRFFSISFLPVLGNYWENIKTYFGSVYSNNLNQLFVFLVGLFSLFLIKHAWLNIQVNVARKQLPLSIGGWGTRGKSGTERLKAALFNGLGLNVVSKTTGCEAMFLHGVAHGQLKEMFLFRPYDKATIWEQVDLLKLSNKLNTDVFLWECMGLTPAYVHILQKHWMRDDYATITNTYPDHEDVQGPAGYDIPNVMVEFIPKNSTLVTSEEVMYPILHYGAKQLNTPCFPVTWMETGAITQDILDRFPYEEHPNNIALVARLAEIMGIPQDFAFRNMADHVVLDLGVLKTYPKSYIRGRSLQYVMGNSANERLGAMGNWTRMGFDDHDMIDDVGTWVTTVINNRADRVPRSKVFAAMLVKDIAADTHFLIGTNLDGFMKFFNEAWNEHYADFSVFANNDNDSDRALDVCQQKATEMRLVSQAAIIDARLSRMLESIEIQTESVNSIRSKDELEHLLKKHDRLPFLNDIWFFVEGWLQQFNNYQKITSLLTKDGKAANEQFIALLRQSLVDRIVIVDDAMTPGETIINLMVDKTPLGLNNRIMGMQNIKGTGLDFVYRWQAWEACHSSCKKLYSKKQAEVAQGLQELNSFKEFGVLSENHMLDCLVEVSDKKIMQSDLFLAKIKEIKQNLDTQMSALTARVNLKQKSSKNNKFFKRLINVVEKVIDLSDAVKRRKKANLIYKDLGNQRISHSKAAIELQELTKRQKGGWLWKSTQNKK